MRAVVRAWVLVLATAACGVRTPARLDVAALVHEQGALGARRELELRIVRHPKDVQARLAVAALDEQVARPSAAIDQLEAVVALGGPAGTRWHADDRARLARLLVARGRVRIARDAASALADLERARGFGAAIADSDLAAARLARARALLRHADAETRAAGVRMIRELAPTSLGQLSWRGAAPDATLGERGAFGAWLWSIGARRAGWDELSAWHDAVPPAAREPAVQASYLVALAWWSPPDAQPPPAVDLVGPARCRFPADGCSPSALAPEDAVLLPRGAARSTDPTEAAAWLAIALQQALHGEGAWGPGFAARVDTAALSPAALPPAARAAYARLTGRTGEAVDAAPATDHDRLVAAAARALAGAGADELRALLGPIADSDEGRTLIQIAVATPPPDRIARPRAVAAVAYARARVPFGPAAEVLRSIVDGYLRDPAVADRLGDDAIAAAPDAAAAHAALGALFDALADPARARARWQAAVDTSPEPAFQLALAATLARVNDPDAALVVGTAAAAASGDPAVAWTAVARALEDSGHHVHALEAARNAIDLAAIDTQAAPLEIAIAASRALGRTAQADQLAAQRARLPPAVTPTDDPTDVDAAVAAHRAHSTAATAARLWVASRWNPRDVPSRALLIDALAPDDARRRIIESELVTLASDRDPTRARQAAGAL